jgi:nitrite reductase/ring-hydroxylating ferredoxin subunit/uncharacterized membrane protein
MTTRNLATIGDAAITAIERLTWLDGIADALQELVHRAFVAAGPAQRRIKNLLHGTWLGHPLHVVLTDVPVGAWTTALILDTLGDADARGSNDYARGADTAVAVGMVGAVAAALPGLADWHYTTGDTRRSGLAHGLLNTAALVLYTRSFALRRSGRRREGRAFSGVGYAVMLAAAYIGGHLVYRQRLGVDQSQPLAEVGDFVLVLSLDELRENQPVRVDVAGARVLLVRRGRHVRALAESCSHLGGPLAEGRFDGDTVICPWHGSRFSLEDGRVIDGPATATQPCYETRIRDGRVEIRRPRRKDSAAELSSTRPAAG